MADLIKVMISSRCKDSIVLNNEKKTYSDLRREIKEALEAEKLFGKQLFEVWINEDSSSRSADKNATEVCLQEVKKADILIVLYNGNAGWASTNADVGICHAEMAQALDTEPAKVRAIKILPLSRQRGKSVSRNQRFRKYFQENEPLWKEVNNGDDAKVAVLETLHDAVMYMVKLGKIEAGRGRHDMGSPLAWSLKDFTGRKKAIEEIMLDYLNDMAYPVMNCPECGLYIKMIGSIKKEEPKEHRVLTLIHAIPDSMSIAAAREMVGRPFYRDCNYSDYLTGVKNDIEAIGPIHFIGCHKNVTETQVRNLVGYPDIILITAPFGVYMRDTVQHIQIVFLAGCRDETGTRNALGRFFGWLRMTGKSSLLVTSAYSRKKIVTAIQEEYSP